MDYLNPCKHRFYRVNNTGERLTFLKSSILSQLPYYSAEGLKTALSTSPSSNY
jgi:hypothetical protein